MYFRDAHKVYRQLSCSNYDKFATHQQQEIIKEKEFCTTNGPKAHKKFLRWFRFAEII